jgi:hypothetical protein
VCCLLVVALPVHAEDTTVGDRIFELWSQAYEQADTTQIGVRRDAAMVRAVPREHTSSRLPSLTPNLDRLLDERHGPDGPLGVSPRATSQPLGHDTFFENPPMISTSKGDYGGGRHARRTRHRDDDRDHDSDSDSRSSCGHTGPCSCDEAHPVPEPGTLLLAGAATAAAWEARRRARRKTQTDN